MKENVGTSSAAVAGVEPRVAFLNDSDANQQLISTKQYARNIMVTSKYTVVSFVPKTIFEFFRVVANVYFLLISLLQLATPWSPTNRFTTAGPLLFVLLVTMIKQGSEDFKRHQADDKQNRRSCRIINVGGQTELIAWQDLQVGQLVCVENREELPADVVIIATSEEEGRCFIETSNLDGETNLKRRVAVKPTAQLVGWRELQGFPIPQETICASAVRRLRGSVEHEQPNNQLYTFTGRLILRDSDRGETAVPLGPENLLLRGCSLRSCAFIVGLVIFTGCETKLLQNSRAAPSKQSKLYRTANRCMLLIFSTMFGLCLASAIAASHWSKTNANRVWYLPFIKEADQADDFIVNFFTFLILYNNLVPISLYVSLDIIKVLQANRITGDSNMSYEGNHAIARTSELNEELGQVEYVFSDKTGTLTCNVMEFRKCSIGGISYGFGTTEIGRAVAALASGKPAAKKQSPTKAKVNPLLVNSQSCESGLRLDIGSTDDVREAALVQQLQGEESFDPKDAQVHFDPQIHFDDPGLLRALYAGGKQGELIHEFLTLLSICHTVIPETDIKTGTVAYRASSPDEEALVKAAKCLGYNFLAPAPLMKVEISCKPSLLPAKSSVKEPRTKSYTIVNVNEFNSTRKRMSVVAVNDESNEYVLYCKGADNMMLERAAVGQNDSDTAVHAKLVGHLQNYAREGLRTLVLGRRVLTEEEYNEYNDAYIAASTALDDREEKLDTCAEMVEKDMQLLGVTAIEDKLQDGVPAAIFDLAQAGIKVWVLTGDREETAVNIGHACRLINDKMQLLYVNAERIDALSGQLDALHETPEIQRLIRGGQVAENLAMVCDGKALVHIFPSRDTRVKLSIEAVERIEKLSEKLLDIARVCKALIACRVSPSQKAEIVQLVRKGAHQECKSEQPITLAIGDGANDVSMIQTAHVGVGICGKEGVQAVNASDYAIAQFRFLTRLVLLHGRCNYKRVCKVIRYSFYKNIALVISLFVFNFYNGQSGAPLFESFVMAGWNFFLALPIIVIGVFDQDISEDVVLKFPQLYRRGQHDSDLNMRVFAKTIVNSVAHALICFFGCYAGNRYTNYGLYVVGTLFYTTLLGTMKLKVALLALNWNKYHLAVLAFSVGLFIFFLLVYPHFTFMSYDMFGVPAYMITLQRYWTLLLLCPIAAMTIDFTATAAQQQFRPTAEDILRERFRPGKSKRVSDVVAPMTTDHGSPSVDKLFIAEQSPDDDKSDGKGQKSNAFVVTAQPPSPNRRTNSTNNLPLYDSFRGSLPQPQARSSFAFNGLDDVAGRHASGDLPAQEAVTMRVLSFQKHRRPSRSTSLGRLPVEPNLVLKSTFTHECSLNSVLTFTRAEHEPIEDHVFANMVVHAQVLSVASLETAPSLLVATETKRFLFNVGDGTQRLCMEHHVRLAKLQQVFLTELRSHIVGGLPGMVLTVSDIGRNSGIHVNGPPGTKEYLKATRHFLYRPDFKLEATEVPITEEKKAKGCYEDDEVVVHAVAVEKVKAGAKRKLNESPSSEGEEQSSHVSVSYVVETRPQRGKFLVDKAKALGVPKGKLFGQLHQGKDVTLPDGRVVKSSDCVLPSVPAAGCVIVSCPTAAHVDALVTSDGFKRYREANGKAEVQVEVVFHLGGVEVLRQSKYQEWARSFGAQARHVLLGHGACAQKTVYRASAKLQAQLHAVFPRAFPSNEAHELNDTIDPFSRVVPDVSSLQLSASSEQNAAKVVLGESMLRFILAPQARRGFDSSRCWPRLDFDQIRESVEIVAKTPDNSSSKSSDEDLLDGRITFLGTGCAIPSKYRNVTGMYLELPIGDDWAGLMLDCGEGSLGQLYRYANGDSKRLQELVNRLKCVWISHNHADHHLGLLRLLSHRPDDSNTEPLLVIGPTPLRFWLDEYAEQDPTVKGKYTFVENYSFDEGDSRYVEVDTHAEAARVRVWLKETLNIAQLECVPVKHALQSYAAVVTFVDGSKLAFSGDCRPSDQLAEKANGAFLIVHEATFEDELTKEAKDKAHCTMAEAIEVGRQANARHLLLTHFSQRYPKMAVLSTEDTEDTMEVLTAIDMLSLRFRELRQPNLMNVITQLMAIDDEEDIDAAQSLKAQQDREERKKQKSIERGEGQ